MAGMCRLDLTYERWKIGDVAKVERARGTEYPAGTICIRVSAAKRSNLPEQFRLLTEPEVLNGDSVVICPRDIEPAYLCEVLNMEAEEWRIRYTGGMINIPMDAFDYLYVNVHQSRETREYMTDVARRIDGLVKEVEERIQEEKDLKDYMLKNMMC